MQRVHPGNSYVTHMQSPPFSVGLSASSQPKCYCSFKDRNTRRFSCAYCRCGYILWFLWSHSAACILPHTNYQPVDWKHCQDGDTVSFLSDCWLLQFLWPWLIWWLFPSHKNQQTPYYYFSSCKNKAVHAAEPCSTKSRAKAQITLQCKRPQIQGETALHYMKKRNVKVLLLSWLCKGLFLDTEFRCT